MTKCLYRLEILDRPETLDRQELLTDWRFLTDWSFLTDWNFLTAWSVLKDWSVVKYQYISSGELLGGWWWVVHLDYSVSSGPFLRFPMSFEFLSEMFDHSVSETRDPSLTIFWVVVRIEY